MLTWFDLQVYRHGGLLALAPGLALLAGLAAEARPGTPRWPWWALAGVLAAIFGGCPGLWEPGAGFVPSGLLWYAPDNWLPAGAHAEFHWRGAVWVAGNLYLLTGLVLLAGLAVAAWRCWAAARGMTGGAAGTADHRRWPASCNTQRYS